MAKHNQYFCEALQHLPIECKSSERRKTLGLKLVPGKVIVSYPSYASIYDVAAWVNERCDWILRHYVDPKPIENSKSYAEHDKIFWNGVYVNVGNLIASQPVDASAFFSDTLIRQKKILLKICSDVAQADFPARLARWELFLGYAASSLKWQPYRSRWGSCTHKSEVALNSLLVMAPSWVRDYVVVHELCHIKYFDHSAFFWRDVSRAISAAEIKNAKRWLRLNGSQLMFIYR